MICDLISEDSEGLLLHYILYLFVAERKTDFRAESPKQK